MGLLWPCLVRRRQLCATEPVLEGPTASSRHNPGEAGVLQELVQCGASEGTLPDIQARCEAPVPTSLQWQPGECIAFAASMANQVAQRLSPHEALVAGVVARFTKDLSRLAAGAGDLVGAGQCGPWQWFPAEELWWPVWWCPYQPVSMPTCAEAVPSGIAGSDSASAGLPVKAALGVDVSRR